MGKVVLAFSMSLDGFVAGPGVSIEQPMGRGGDRLHDWLLRSENIDPIDRQMAAETGANAGAVVLGRRTFEIGIGHWHDTPYPVPSFVLTHRPHDPLLMKSAPFTFITEGIDVAIDHARAASGDRNIIVMGAETARQALQSGLADEIVIQLVSILLGEGTRLFPETASNPPKLTQTLCQASSSVTHLRYSVNK